MELAEKISFEEIDGASYKVRVIESLEYGKAALTHYFHNSQNEFHNALKKKLYHI